MPNVPRKTTAQIEERRRKIREARSRLKEIKRVVTMPDGTRSTKSFYGATKEEAERAYRDYLNPPLTPAAPEGVSWADRVPVDSVAWWAIVKYAPLKAHRRAKTKENLQLAARHLLSEIGLLPIAQLNATNLTVALARIADKKTLRNKAARPKPVRQPDGSVAMVPPTPIYRRIGASLVNRCRRLALELNELAYEEHPDRVRRINPKRVPVREEEERQVEIYTPAAMRILVEATRGTVAFVPAVLYCFAGLRLNEALGIMVDDVHPDGVLHVLKQAGPGGALADLKTRYSKRALPLPAGMIEELRPCAFGAKGCRLARGRDRGADRGGPLSSDNVVRSLSVSMRRAGLPAASPHELRHSFSTWLDENGCPRSIRLALMGQSTRAVADRYNHPSLDRLREWLGKLWDASFQVYDGPALRPLAPEQSGAKRPATGETNGRSVLSAGIVRDVVRPRLARGDSSAAIARDLGVHPKTIRKIARGETWREAV